MSLQIEHFSGIAPKVSARQLRPDMAQMANNCRLIGGDLQAFKDLLVTPSNTLIPGVQTIFRMDNGVTDYWLSWDKLVNVVRGAVANDTEKKIYWTGDSEPRCSDLALAIAGGGIMPASCFVLGVSAPTVAPTVTPSGGSGLSESRAYVETFVTPWGEESAPSPASAVTSSYADATWALTGLNAAPINTAAISGATSAGGVTTITTASTAHLRAGEELLHASVVGMTDLNGKFPILAVVDATHYQVSLTTAQVYTSGGTWARVAPHNTTGMTRRIYRTVNADYFFVVELPIATTSYNDTILDTALGEVLPTLGWIMPPATMTGLITLPNGSTAGIDGNNICFSVPYAPYAWPIAYRQASNFQCVALGAFGSSLIVGTQGVPLIITGSDPSSLSVDKTEVKESCLSARGMVDVGSGVMYPSVNGLAFIGDGGANMGTKALFSKDEWAQINSGSLQCVWHGNLVFGWFNVNAAGQTGFAFDMSSEAFAMLTSVIDTCYVDDETNEMFMVSGGVLYQWDAHPYNTLNFDWKSKVFVSLKPILFGYAIVDADYAASANSNAAIAAATAFNTNILTLANAEGAYDDVNDKGTLDSGMLDEFMLDGSNMIGGSSVEITATSLRLTVYADGVQVYSAPVTQGRAFPIAAQPADKASLWEFELSGNIPVYSLVVAESALGLRS